MRSPCWRNIIQRNNGTPFPFPGRSPLKNAGEKAVFSVEVLRSSTLLDNVEVYYEAGPDMYPNVKKQAVLKDGTMKYTATMKKPGFYRLKVKAHVGNKDYEGSCTAAFSPEEIKPFAQCPNDFDTFWQNALKDARNNDLNPTRTLLPERCTKDVNVYEVSFVNNRWGSRIYGILCIPVTPGKYPTGRRSTTLFGRHLYRL